MSCKKPGDWQSLKVEEAKAEVLWQGHVHQHPRELGGSWRLFSPVGSLGRSPPGKVIFAESQHSPPC